MRPSAARTLSMIAAVSSLYCSGGRPSAKATFLSARLISSTSTSFRDALAESSSHRVALSSLPGGVTLPTIASSLVGMKSLACYTPGEGNALVSFALGGLASHERDQLAPVVDCVFERIESTNQESRDAKIIVGEHRLGDLLRRPHQRSRISASAGRCRHCRPQPFVEYFAFRGCGQQALRTNRLRRFRWCAQHRMPASLANRFDDAPRARPRRVFGRCQYWTR